MERGVPFHEHALVLGDGGQARSGERSIHEMKASQATDVGLRRLGFNSAVLHHHADRHVTSGEVVKNEVAVPGVQADGRAIGGHEGLLNGDGRPRMLATQDIDTLGIVRGHQHLNVGQ